MIRHVAVFNDGSVSLPYPTRERLQAANRERWSSLREVVTGEDDVTILARVRAVLHTFASPFACACPACVRGLFGDAN